MGQVNNVLRRYLRDKKRFADLFNGVFWSGKTVIQAGNLMEVSGTEGMRRPGSSRTMERERDIKMNLNDGGILRIVALENQNLVDYSMPFRCMECDVGDYGRQLEEIRKKNEKTQDYSTSAERLCRVKKTDRLIPAHTLCLYHGEDLWDGPRSLRDMMRSEALQEPFNELFSDYPFRLYCINEETDTSVFATELGMLFEMLKYRRDKKGLLKLLEDKEQFQHMDKETLEVASVLMHIPRIWEERMEYKNGEEKEEYNMCQAIRELMEDSRNEGVAEGVAMGEESGILMSIRNLMQTLKYTEEQAMNVLLVPEEKREKYRAQI